MLILSSPTCNSSWVQKVIKGKLQTCDPINISLINITTVGKHVDFVETSMEIKAMSTSRHPESGSTLHKNLEQRGKLQAITTAAMGVAPLAQDVQMSNLLEPIAKWFRQWIVPSVSAMNMWTRHHISMTASSMFVSLEAKAKTYSAGPLSHMSVPASQLMFEFTLGDRTLPAVSPLKTCQSIAKINH